VFSFVQFCFSSGHSFSMHHLALAAMPAAFCVVDVLCLGFVVLRCHPVCVLFCVRFFAPHLHAFVCVQLFARLAFCFPSVAFDFAPAFSCVLYCVGDMLLLSSSYPCVRVSSTGI
jgi:hypothetical protein